MDSIYFKKILRFCSRMCKNIVRAKKNVSCSCLWSLFFQLFYDLSVINLLYQLVVFVFRFSKCTQTICLLFEEKKCGQRFLPMQFLDFCWRFFTFKNTNWRLSFSLWTKLVNPWFISCTNFIKTFASARIKIYQHILAQWHSSLPFLLN